METPSKHFTTREAIQMGLQVLAKKRELEHGEFLTWVFNEHHRSEDTVERWMAAAQRAAEVEIPLDDPALDNIIPSALYRLCKKSTPPDALRTAIAYARQGETVTYKFAQAIIEALSLHFTNLIEPIGCRSHLR